MTTSATDTRAASKRNLPEQVWTSVGEWTRPAAWLALPDISAQQRVAALVRIDPASNFLAFTVSGAYTVDWGDGSAAENFASGATAYHEYTYSAISNTGESELGYRQVIVQIYPQAGNNITSLNFNVRHNRAGLNTTHATGMLDLWINCTNCSSLGISSSASNPVCGQLVSAVINVGSGLTGCADLFRGLFALKHVSLSGTTGVTTMSSTFQGCTSLTFVRLFNTAAVTTMSSTFQGCTSLESVPLFNTAAVTNMNNMFNNCTSLKSVPLFNTAAVQFMSGAFSSCTALTSVPLFNTAAVTNMSNMFQSCESLESVPLFNTAAVTNMTGFLSFMPALKSVPLFNTAAVAGMVSMFHGSSSLRSVPLFNTAAVTNMSNMFNSCTSLESVPLFNTAAVTDMNGIFASCRSLRSVPLFNTAAVTNMNNMFQNCNSMSFIPALSAAGISSAANMLTGFFGSVSACRITSLKFTVSFSGCKLSADEIATICGNLTAGTASRTLTLTGNYGLGTVTRTGYGTTAGSTTVTQTNTASLAVGMLVTGTGVSTGVAVTFTDAGDTVTRTAHGLENGTRVSFTAITSTTGITTNTPYFVVNATTNTFQVSATSGGAAINLVTNGSGTLIYPTYITAITTNTNITLSEPASATGTVSLTATVADYSLATLKGFAVTV
jgi:surface protein